MQARMPRKATERKSQMKDFVIFDMEWNMGYQPKIFQYQGIDQTLRGEIIQIGAVKLENGRVADRFSINLKPHIFPKLHHHVAKVTGLTQADLDVGIPIQEGLRRFMEWCGPDAVLGEWGLDDVPVLKQNMVLNGLSEEWPQQWYDIQRIFTSQKPRKEGEGMTLEAVVERLGIPKNEAFHDALSDAEYTAAICGFLNLEQGLQEYPSEEQQLHDLLCPAEKDRRDFTIWRGIVDGEVWTTSQELRQAVCPECGQPLQLDSEDIWLRKGNNCLYSMGQCSSHGPVMIWLRRMRLDGLRYTFARVTEPADQTLQAKWKKEKQAAIERARRKKEHEAAEALERVRNAGR